MPSLYKILGQVVPAATTLTNIYTAPAATSAIGSTLTVCNQGVSTLYRIAVRPAGAAVVPAHYIVYDNYVNANDTVFLTLGITLGPTDVLSVYAVTANVSFNFFGTEIS